MRNYPLTLYYDASCPLCNAEMRNLMLRNDAGRLAFVDASENSFESPVFGIDRAQMMAAMHGVWADGNVSVGVEAIHEAYLAVGLGHITSFTQWPVVGSALKALYPVFARHRQRVPRWLVQVLFEGPIRRSAEAAHARMNCTNSGCDMPHSHTDMNEGGAS